MGQHEQFSCTGTAFSRLPGVFLPVRLPGVFLPELGSLPVPDCTVTGNVPVKRHRGSRDTRTGTFESPLASSFYISRNPTVR
jgi:hypothetical protein